MIINYDPKVDVARFYFGPISRGGIAYSYPGTPGTLIEGFLLDFDDQDHLIALDVQAASLSLPSRTLALANRPEREGFRIAGDSVPVESLHLIGDVQSAMLPLVPTDEPGEINIICPGSRSVAAGICFCLDRGDHLVGLRLRNPAKRFRTSISISPAVRR